MNVESWCLVEAAAKQNWQRSQRKHFPNALDSTVFDKQQPNRFEERSAKIKMVIEEIPKKKRFPGKCKRRLEYKTIIITFEYCRWNTLSDIKEQLSSQIATMILVENNVTVVIDMAAMASTPLYTCYHSHTILHYIGAMVHVTRVPLHYLQDN